MANVFDVAAYIIQKAGPVSHMKLQKLVYYAQAWSLVWEEEPLFPERIEAWLSGPVVPPLFKRLEGVFKVTLKALGPSNPASLTETQRDTVDKVLEFYGARDAQWLSDLTHRESPWQEARKGLLPNERGTTEITHAMMSEYYSSI